MSISQFRINHTVTHTLLHELKQPSNDVLSSKQEQRARMADLYRAVSMESLYRQKMVFWIECQSICIPIESHVVAVGDRSVFIEHKLRIPIASICRIQFLDRPGVLFS